MKIFTLLADTSNNPIELAIRLGVWIWTNPLVWIVLIVAAGLYIAMRPHTGDNGPP